MSPKKIKQVKKRKTTKTKVRRVSSDARRGLRKTKKTKAKVAKSSRLSRGPVPKTSVLKASEKLRLIPQRSTKVFVDAEELPFDYNITNVTLIARDPYWVHAYWEIAPLSLEKIRKQIGEEINRSAYVLRMYDVTLKDFDGTNANRWFDIDVGPFAQNWYINLWDDHVTYCADLGIRTPSGQFFALARSNFVTTPRQASSGRCETIWMEVKDDHQQRPYVYVEPYKPTKRDFSKQSIYRRKRLYLTEDDVRAYYSRLFPLLNKILSARLKGGRARLRTSRDILFEKFRLESLREGGLLEKSILGASEEMALRRKGAGKNEELSSGASVREEKKKGFYFEIGTELIVYGRTEPDAEVWMGNKKIELRKDGTFTLRFALPDGKIPFDFTAVSNVKDEQRKISTVVERYKTKYQS